MGKKKKLELSKGYSFAENKKVKGRASPIIVVKNWVMDLVGMVVFIEKQPRYVGVKGCAIFLLFGMLLFTIYQIFLTRQSIEDSRYATNVSIISNSDTPDSLYVHSLNELHDKNSFDSLEISRAFGDISESPYIEFVDPVNPIYKWFLGRDNKNFGGYTFLDSRVKLRVIGSSLSWFEAKNSTIMVASYRSKVHIWLNNTSVSHRCLGNHKQTGGSRHDYGIQELVDQNTELDSERSYKFVDFIDSVNVSSEPRLNRNTIHYVFTGDGSEVTLSGCENSFYTIGGGTDGNREQHFGNDNQATLVHLSNSRIDVDARHIYMSDIDNSKVTIGVYPELVVDQPKLKSTHTLTVENISSSRIVLMALDSYEKVSINNVSDTKFYVFWTESCDELEKARVLGLDVFIENMGSCIDGVIEAEHPPMGF